MPETNPIGAVRVSGPAKNPAQAWGRQSLMNVDKTNAGTYRISVTDDKGKTIWITEDPDAAGRLARRLPSAPNVARVERQKLVAAGF